MSGSRTEYPRHVLEDFAAGVECTRTFTITPADLARFADASGDHHPLHRDTELAKRRGYPGVLVHGMLVASRCSAFVAHDFIGSQGLLVSVASDFRQPVFCGDTLVWRGKVARVVAEAATVEISWQVTNGSGVIVQRGTACARLPSD